MFDGDDGTKGNDRRVAAATGCVRRRRWSAVEKGAVIRETLVPGANIWEVARRWQVDPQPVYRWRHSEGVTHRSPTKGSGPATPDFVPIVTDAMPACEAAPVALAGSVIEIHLAGAVVRLMSGLDDARLTMVLRAVRASALRA